MNVEHDVTTIRLSSAQRNLMRLHHIQSQFRLKRTLDHDFASNFKHNLEHP